MFYSDEAGFTTIQINEGQLEISDEIWQEIVIGQSKGKVIKQDESGFPVLKDPDPFSMEQLSLIAENKRTALLEEARKAISIWQTKLMIGRKLTEKENSLLNAWLDYIDTLEAIDTHVTSKDMQITWPVTP